MSEETYSIQDLPKNEMLQMVRAILPRLGPQHALEQLTGDGTPVIVEVDDGIESPGDDQITYDDNGIGNQPSVDGFVHLREIEAYRIQKMSEYSGNMKVFRAIKAGPRLFCWNPEDKIITFSERAERIRLHIRDAMGKYWSRLWTHNESRWVYAPIPVFDANMGYDREAVPPPDDPTRTIMMAQVREDHALVLGERDGLNLPEVIDNIKAYYEKVIIGDALLVTRDELTGS